MEYDSAALESIAKRFRRDMWAMAPEDAVIESGVEVRAFGSVQATVFAEFSEIPRINTIQGAAEVADGHLAEAVEWMRAREVDCRISVAADRPGTAEAEEWLRRRGFERGEGWEKFVRDASLPSLVQPPEIEILELGFGEGEGMDWIAAEGLGLPHLAGLLFYDLPGLADWRCFVALLEGELVACGSMLIHDGIAELGIDATMEHARGRGCNLALIRRRLIEARKARCHTVFAELGDCEAGSSSAIRHNLQRAGFDEAYDCRNWQRPRFVRSGLENGVPQR